MQHNRYTPIPYILSMLPSLASFPLPCANSKKGHTVPENQCFLSADCDLFYKYNLHSVFILCAMCC